MANPRQIRDFGRATGQLSKTDSIDAEILALFAERVRPEPRPLPDQAAQALDTLLTRRRQLIEMLTAEKNRLGFARASVRKSISQHMRWLGTVEPCGVGESSGVAAPRSTLYMSALVACRHNSVIRAFYLRLPPRGSREKSHSQPAPGNY